MNQIFEYRKTIINAKKVYDKVFGNTIPTYFVTDEKSPFSQKVKEMQLKLGIYGGGIALLSKSEGKPFLLYSPEVQKHFDINYDINEYEYLKTPYELDWIEKGLNYFIDLLFFISRNTDCPEYVKKIKDEEKNPFEYPFQQKIRKELEILHCSAGEVLFFSILWRVLIDMLIKTRDLKTKYNPELFKLNSIGSDWLDAFSSTEGEFVEKILIEKISEAEINCKENPELINNPINQSAINAKKLIGEFIEETKSIKIIYEQLNAFDSKALIELNNYTQYIFKGAVPKLTEDKLTEDDVNSFTDEALRAFANLVEVSLDSYTIGTLIEALHKSARFPILPYYFLLLFDKKKGLKEHVVFPLWYTYSTDTAYSYTDIIDGKSQRILEPAILHSLNTIKPIWEHKSDNWYTVGKDETLNPFFEEHLTDLFLLFTAMSKPIIDKEYYAEQRKSDVEAIKKQATKSAVSQYMSRNLSHNLGSHSIPQFNLLLNKKIDNKEPWSGNKLFQIRGYNEYIQGRMEFLAEFSSKAFSELYVEYPIKSICEKLKQSINFNPSEPNNSGEFEIVFKGMIDSLQKRNGRDLKIKIGEIPKGIENVDIRGDNLGIQAFYLIIENVIRNLYKHSKPAKISEEDTIFFYINLTEPTDQIIARNFYAIDIIDRHGRENLVDRKDKERVSSITGQIEVFNPIDKINRLIQQKILKDTDNTLREEGWGMLEMKSAAAYLLGLPLEYIDTPFSQHIIVNGEIYPYPLLASYRSDEEMGNENNIGFRFYLPKSKFCLIDAKAPVNESELKDVGIEFGNKIGGRHKFFVGNSNSQNEAFINQRFVNINELADEEIKNLNKENNNKFKITVWGKYLEQFSNIKNISDEDIYYARDNKQLCVTNPENSIVFNVHAVNIKYDGTNSNILSKQKLFPENINPLFFYYESFPSANQFSEKIDPKSQPYLSMLKETAAIRISIFDERIQESSYSNDEQKYDLASIDAVKETRLQWRDILLSSGVYIPPIEKVDLLKLVKEKDDGEAIKLKEHIKERVSECEYLIIHFTLLEILFGFTDKELIGERLSKFISDYEFDKNKKALVLISGRGRPSNLPEGNFFANYTTIADCVGKDRSKFRLVTILKSLRKIH